MTAKLMRYHRKRKRKPYKKKFGLDYEVYGCAHCPSTFNKRSNLVFHLKHVPHDEMEIKPPKFMCEYPKCGTSFKSKSNLSRHTQKSHTLKRSKKTSARAAAQHKAIDRKKNNNSLTETMSQNIDAMNTAEAVKQQQIVHLTADFRDKSCTNLPIDVVIEPESQSMPFVQASHHSHSPPSQGNGRILGDMNETPTSELILPPIVVEDFEFRKIRITNPISGSSLSQMTQQTVAQQHLPEHTDLDNEYLLRNIEKEQMSIQRCQV